MLRKLKELWDRFWSDVNDTLEDGGQDEDKN